MKKITGSSAAGIILCTFLVGAIAMSTVVAEAVSEKRDSTGKSFGKAWSVTAINEADRTFKYGFNTKFIDEDFTHTYHRTKSHTAYVKNSSRAQTKNVKAGKYSKPEITHESGKVFYEYSY